MSIELYHEPTRNLLVYKGPANARILETVKEAKAINGAYVALPRTLYNCQLLQWIDVPVPQIMDGYDWPHNKNAFPPGAKVPTDAQRCMANFMALHPRCFNLSDMGTMKTMAALWAAEFIMCQHPRGTCRGLIVAPLSILQRVWGDAIFSHFIGRRNFSIVHGGNAAKRERELARDADFYIINFDGLTVGAEKRRGFILGGLSKILADRTDIRIVVVDEARAYSDRRTDRHDAARLILAPRPYLWMLTATPTPNAPTDAYGQAALVNGAFGETFKSFERRTMVQVSRFKKVPALNGYQAAARLLQPAVRFGIDQVWDGPELTVQRRLVELTDKQRNMLSKLKRDQQVVLQNGTVMTMPNEAVLRGKALQILMGAVYDSDHQVHRTDAIYRIKELREVIEEATKKILVFVPLTSVINLLYEELTKEHGCIILNGQVPQTVRSERISQFKDDPGIRVALADPSTVAHGINEFVAATTVCWYGPTDKTELYIQGNKRAHRPGQHFPVTVVHLVASNLEREIFKRLGSNEGLQGMMLKWVQEEEI